MGFRKLFGPPSPLDDPLFIWPDGSPFTVAHMLRSVQCKGITGSGKTSGPGAHFIRKLAKHPRATMLIIAQKPEEADEVRKIFKQCGKADKLIVFEPDGPWRMNFIDVEAQAGADATALTDYIETLGEALVRAAKEEELFWKLIKTRIISCTVEALRQGNGKVAIPEAMEFLSTAAYSTETISDIDKREKWDKLFHSRVMVAGKQRHELQKTALQGLDRAQRLKAKVEIGDWQAITNFFAGEFIRLDDKPRSSALASINNTFYTACTGLVRELTSTDTNVSPKIFDEGYSMLVNFPFSEYGPTGRYIAAGIKRSTQNHVLRNKWKPGDYFNVIYCDEFQESVTDYDARYLAQCRSHGGCMLTLTQTVNSEYSVIAAHAKVDALLANFGTHIFNLSDPKSAEFASGLMGQYREVFVSITPDNKRTPWDIITGHGPQVNISESYQPVLQPRALMHDMRTGGAGNGFIVDGLVIRNGEPFASGSNGLWVEFKQQ